MKRRPLSLSSRLFLAYAAFVASAGWLVVREMGDEIKPAVRQSTEETLVDTANLLAEVARDDLRAGRLSQGQLPELLARYGARRPRASIWGLRKAQIDSRVYIVDRRGVVLVDSAGRDVGRDYSRWNDIYRTLRGQYGARTTHDVPGDPSTSVMYVAAPIYDGADIIGAVSVAKPSRSVQPVIERARRQVVLIGAGLIAAGLALGALLSLWLGRVIRRLTRFALEVSAGRRAALPELPGHELGQLARALESMRTQLEGKAYVERYVQTLTHELKSPLTAITGAAELLRRDMQPEQRERFLSNIESEAARLQSFGERMLDLAHVEQRRGLEERARVELEPLIEELLESHAARLAQRQIRAINVVARGTAALGERFLIRQALSNLIDNAADFGAEGGELRVSMEPEGGGHLSVCVFNSGAPIPDYALQRVTERFYSLPRPSTGRKSSGLGLSFVQEVAELHDGTFRIENAAGGVEARLTLRSA